MLQNQENPKEPNQPVPLALTGGLVFPSPEAPSLEDATVLVEGGMISSIDPSNISGLPRGTRVIDCSDRSVLAGFQNSHIHFTEGKWEAAGQLDPGRLENQLREMLTSYGFTTVVDTASLLPNTVDIRRRIDSGEVLGPRILTAGLALYPPEGLPFYLREGFPPDLIPLIPQPRGGSEARGFIRANLNGGADLIKLFTGSWVTQNEVAVMPREVAAAAVSEAHRHGKLVFTHPSNVAGLEVALQAGVDVLAHAIDDTDGLTMDHLRRMRVQGMAMIPTLKLLAQDGRKEVLDQVRNYSSTGGDLLFGTDVGFLEDYSPLREYELLGETGLTWQEILASLTTTPARRFGDLRRGRLEPGMAADIVVLGSDPRTGPAAFADVLVTIRAGEVIFDRSAE
ncbi:MAG TPA: amidohydrolase family protein [Anaerolineales bacterium]|nr:amidohydrolase family protein [Anaerolineales bacterium]